MRYSPCRNGWVRLLCGSSSLATGLLAFAAHGIAQSAADFETPEYLATNGLQYIGASTAYAAGYTGAGSLIAVMDDGFQLDHPELVGKFVDQQFFGPGGGNVPIGDHGTHTAATAAGNRDGSGTHGVAFGAKLALYTAFSPPAVTPAAGVPLAFQRAAAAGATVISNSWGDETIITEFQPGGQGAADPTMAFGWLMNGGPRLGRDPIASDRTDGQGMISAFDDAQRTSVIVFSAANEASLTDVDISAGLPLIFPELSEAWLAVVNVNAGPTVTFTPDGEPPHVTETYQSGQLASAPCGQAAQFCLAAPGVQVNSARANPPNSYVKWEGTSMATPHVSGAVAVAREMFPDASPEQLAQLILRSAEDIGAPGVDWQFGWGLLSLANLTSLAKPEGQRPGPVGASAQFSTLGAFAGVLNGAAGTSRSPVGGFQTQNVVTRSTRGLGSDSLALGGVSQRTWLMAMAEQLSVKSGSTWNGYQARTGGLAWGHEFSAETDGARWHLGAAIGHSQSGSVGAANSGDGRTFATHAGIYGGHAAGRWQLDGSFQVARMRNEQSRFGVGGGGAINQVASATYASVAAEARARLGYTFGLGAASWTPFLDAQARFLHSDGYTETGAGALNRTVAADTILQAEIGPGIRAERTLLDAGGWQVKGAFDLAGRVVLGEYRPSTRSSIFGRTVDNPGVGLGRHVATVGAELAVGGLGGRWDSAIRYEGRFRQNAISHALSAHLSWVF